ncbi:MAG: AAA family ATPase [Deltaproteobacteria bacterium]|nr:AAA family ATPase [Deltaproteobacteria bacterium]
MSKDGKFGTFGGVFTPSILTILGVIMYLRLPWVVGNGGLWMSLGIIAVAHVISITTGLSISSIATDKNVGAGGPYYIVSRSLGLPIGGTLGLALFVGLSFSISLYVIGFCESFLSFIDMAATPANVRVAGTITVVLLTIVTLISTAFAIKTQYLILGLIGLSLLSIFAGSSVPAPTVPLLDAPADAPSLGVMFGIFFPAVTGFTAGVNMSGDLKDPKRSIPSGTLVAIGVGMLVYLALGVFLAYRVDPVALRTDTDVLNKMALVPALVVAGVWGATLSSALGSILGAPRILQAMSVDRITPRIFGKGHGKNNEPRNALLLAFAIGEGGILIAELDIIARVVSMVFLATYGFLNISSAIESWASPDFRPAFRIPRLVSVIGAVTSAIVMIQLDFAAMAGATVLMAVLFGVLKRRQLTLDAGDTWEGIWSSIVRTGLHRLSQGRGKSQRRNWRPNVLTFSHTDSPSRTPLLELSSALITGNGLLTDFQLHGRGSKPEADDEPSPLGVFRRPTVSEDFHQTVVEACRHHGFSGIDPNTVLLDWDTGRKEPEAFSGLLRTAADEDFNLLLLRYDGDRGFGQRGRIDVWWRADQGNVSLSLALMRFVTRFEPWQGAALRFLLVSEDTAFSDDLLHAMRGVLREARVEAKVKVMASPSQTQGWETMVRAESSDADLVVLGLPDGRLDEKRLQRLDGLLDALGTTLLLRGSSLFGEVLPRGGRRGLVQAIERAQASATELRPLHLPKIAELEEPAAAFAGRLGTLTDELYRGGLAPLLARHESLLSDVRQLVERQFEIVRKGVGEADPARARKPAGRAQGGFLFKARKLVAQFEEDELPNQTTALRARLDTFVDSLRRLGADGPATVRVRLKDDELVAKPDDEAGLRRFKRRRRWAAALSRRPAAYDAPVGVLRTWAIDAAGADLLEQTLRAVEAGSHRLAVQLGKILNETATELGAMVAAIDRREVDADGIEDRKRRLIAQIDASIEPARELAESTAARLAEHTHELSQGFARDIERLDLGQLVRSERRPPKPARATARFAGLRASPDAWRHHQTLLLHRAQLGLQIAAFQHRFSVLALRARNDIAQEIRSSVLGDGAAMVEALETFADAAERGESPKPPADRDLEARFDGHAVLEAIARDVDEHVRELPETATTLSDEAIAELESGVATEADEISVSVRPLVKYLIETDFFDVVTQEITGIPMQEQRTVGVARDVMRLLSFTMGDLEAAGGWSNDALRAQVVGVAREGARRLAADLEVLTTTVDAFVERVARQLETLREETAPYALTSRSDSLSHYIRSRGSQRAVSRLREAMRRVTHRARDGFVALLYRRSAGVLFTRQLSRRGGETGATVVDQVTTLTHGLTPRRDLLRSLPFYYRQLFSGQATVGETFWVGRKAELERARALIRRHEQGSRGALFVVGEIGAGKTALCQAIATKLLPRRTIYRITPPPGGAIELAAFRLAVEGEVEQRGDLSTLLRKVPDNAVLMFDDLEMWWERSADGMAVLDCILELLHTHGDRLLFIANLNVHAWRVLGSMARLSEHALGVIECESLPAEALKSIISLRHGSTGVKFELAGVAEDDLAPWRQARLFTRYFDFSDGLVAVALRTWLANIDKVDGDTLHIRWPRRPRADVLARLRVELRVMLVQLVVHKQVTLRRLRRLSATSTAELDADLSALVRMGLVRRDERDVLHVDRFVAHLVTDRLRAQGMLA